MEEDTTSKNNSKPLDNLDHCDSGGSRNELEFEQKESMDQTSKIIPSDTRSSGNQVTDCNMHLLANAADHFLHQSPSHQLENNDESTRKITAEPSHPRDSNYSHQTNVRCHLPNKPVLSLNPNNLADSTVQDLNLVSGSSRPLNYPSSNLSNSQTVVSASTASSPLSSVNTVSSSVSISNNQQCLNSEPVLSGNLERHSDLLLPPTPLVSTHLSSNSSLQQSSVALQPDNNPTEMSPYITQTPVVTASADDVLIAGNSNLIIQRTSEAVPTSSAYCPPQVHPVAQPPILSSINPASDNGTNKLKSPVSTIPSDGNGVNSQNTLQQHKDLSSSSSKPFQATSVSTFPATTLSPSSVYVSNNHTNNNNARQNLTSLTINPESLEIPSVSSSSVMSNFNNLKPEQSDAAIESSFFKESSNSDSLHTTSASTHNELIAELSSKESTVIPTSSSVYSTSSSGGTSHDNLCPSDSKSISERKDTILESSNSILSCNKDAMLSKSNVAPAQSHDLTSDSNRTLSVERAMVGSTSGEKDTALAGDNTLSFSFTAHVNSPSTTNVESISQDTATVPATSETVISTPIKMAESSSGVGKASEPDSKVTSLLNENVTSASGQPFVITHETNSLFPSGCNETSTSRDEKTSNATITTVSAGNVSSSSGSKIIEESSICEEDTTASTATVSLSSSTGQSTPAAYDKMASIDNDLGVGLSNPKLDSNKSALELTPNNAQDSFPSTSEAACLDTNVTHAEENVTSQHIRHSPAELNNNIEPRKINNESKNNLLLSSSTDAGNASPDVDCQNSSASDKRYEAVQNTTVSASASNSLLESDKNQGISTSDQNDGNDQNTDKHFSVDNVNSPVNAVSSSNSVDQKTTAKTHPNNTESNTCSSTMTNLDQQTNDDDNDMVQSQIILIKENIKVETSDGSSVNVVNDGTSEPAEKTDECMMEVDMETSRPVENNEEHGQIKRELTAENITAITDTSSPLPSEESDNKTTSVESKNSNTDDKQESSSVAQTNWNSPIGAVNYTLAEPRRSQRQPKVKFNVLDLIGLGPDVDIQNKPAKTLSKRISNADSSEDIGNEETLMLASNISASFVQTSPTASKKYKEADAEKIYAPFEQGWRREVVIRSVYKEFTKSGKPKTAPADIYYYTPDNKKLRSMVQIVNYLEGKDTNLTVENFNFLRRSIYKPPFEMVRTAGSHGVRHRNPDGEFLFDKKTSKKIRKESYGSNDSMTIEDDSDVQLIERPPYKKLSLSGGKTNNKFSKLKSKSSPAKRQAENSNSSEVTPKRIKSVARKSTTLISKSMLVNMNKRNAFQPCSLNCPGLTGIPPQLHCDICMCLFHNSCVNLKEDDVPQNFKCKNCEMDLGDWIPPVETTASNSLSGNRTSKTHHSSWNNEKGRKSTMPSVIQISKDTNFLSQASKSDSQLLKSASNGSPRYVVMNIVKSSDSLSSDPSQSYHIKDLQSTSDIPDCKSQIQASLNTLQASVSPRLKSNKSNNSLNASKTLSHSSPPLPHPVPSSVLKDTSSISETTAPNTFTVTNTPSTSASLNTLIQTTKDLNVTTSSSSSPSDCPVNVSSPKSLTSTHSQPNISSANIKLEVPSSSPSSSSNVSDSEAGKDNYPRSGQLLTLPLAVAKRLDSSLPLALRINNMQLFIPPSRCINTPEGLKVFLPPKTFSVPSGSTTTMNITFSSGTVSGDSTKDYSVSLSEKNKGSESNQAVDKSKTLESAKTISKIQKCRNKFNNYLCPFKKLYSGYSSMLQIFHYLSAGDLVRCSLVCKSWHQLATQPSLWKAIHLNNTRISNWTLATKYFNKYTVEELSLRGMKLGDDWNRIWHQLTPVLDQLTTLKRIYFDQVPALMLYTVCEKLPNLQELTAKRISDISNEQQWTTPTKIDLTKFCNVKMLKKLQLRGTGGLVASFPSGIFELIKLKQLRHLSITSLKASDHDFDYLGELRNLKVLELGECINWTSETYFQLGKLVNLERLHLELGGNLNDVSLAKALGNLKCLRELELMLFVISDKLHTKLSPLTNLSKLVIWPDTTHQPAVINSNTFALVTKLVNLKFLEWGIVRNKICETQNLTDTEMNAFENVSQSNMELIPFLSLDDQNFSNKTNLSNDISIRQLNDKLKAMLPKTKISLLQSSDVLASVNK
ncbi:serine-rich adhesin for platelets [Octopus bimaculoides]|uniref:MBD domain-containing protein n=1 Tax=Octopus bimaculoides TaxID=37653 RepID=A0A0L8GFN2_OCTBM|nr:serine-rich adhesin for platelets [Octopus bimaculoides]|eukprot:XP_014781477.1 PREDICTED: serine-rich adhesin for platelets-like [Octopus bimaculoides]